MVFITRYLKVSTFEVIKYDKWTDFIHCSRIPSKQWKYLPFYARTGYICLFQGKAYGWCAEKGEAKTERPTALIVSLSGEIFEATGGNHINGAKRWKKYNVNFWIRD